MAARQVRVTDTSIDCPFSVDAAGRSGAGRVQPPREPREGAGAAGQPLTRVGGCVDMAGRTR